MRVRAPLMIQDPEISQMEVGRLVEDWLKIDEDHYLDGPVTPRVAVIDLNPNTEALEPGAVFIPPEGRRTLGSYKVDRKRIYSPHFIQVSVFATVLRTMYMYEEQDTLGRRVAWGFDAPQLLVVPRAGWWANAYYERRSHSLQFYSFRAGSKLIHTSLSRDIVAHETAHALIDGIDPDLYDALDPQSLALHEGVADLTAVLIAFRSGKLRRAVLDKTEGSIEKSTNFSSIGEQFGRAIDPEWPGRLAAQPAQRGQARPRRRPGRRARGARAQPGHHRRPLPIPDRPPHRLQAAAGRALRHVDVLRLRAGAVRRLGAVQADDPARARLHATRRDHLRRLRTRHPRRGPGLVRGRHVAALAARELRRCAGSSATESDLDVETNVPSRAIRDVDLQGLVDSDWVAFTFAEKNRKLLGIPPRAQFQVLPRIVVSKRFEQSGESLERAAAANEDTASDAGPDAAVRPLKELLFKVRWSQTERNPRDLGGAPKRRIQTGVTLVIDWDQRLIRSLLRPLDLAGRRTARDAMLRRLMERGLVQVSSPDDPDAVQKTLGTGIEAVVTDGILRVRETARLLHVAKDAGDA